MTYLPNQGKRPDGSFADIPVGGTKYLNSTPLGANESVNTGWMSTQGYGALLYVIRSDQAGATNGITVEYSDDGTNAIAGGAAISYTQVNMQIQRVLVPKGLYTRITYKNGTTAQTSFRLEVKLSTTLVQPTEGSLNLPMSDSALAMYPSSDLQLTDGTSYDRITRTGNSMNVNITGGAPATDTSALATSARQDTGNTSLSSILSRFTPATSATVTNATTLATVTTVLAANPNRRGAKFTSLTGTILIKYGTGASATSYTERLVTNGTHELPGSPAPYGGIVTAIGAGTLLVTEW